MKHQRNFLFSILFLCLFNSKLFASTLFIYRDFTQKGDEGHAQGIIRAYKAKIKDANFHEFDIGQEENLKSCIEKISRDKAEKNILIAIGETTISSFSKLLPLRDIMTVHSCHMVTNDHNQLINKINFIVLPLHIADNFEEKIEGKSTKLIKTIGVSHNRQISTIEDIYNRHKLKIPYRDYYLGVILGGDAPTPSHKILLFIQDNARKLARSIVSVLGRKHLLIINGPRTGKYNPDHPLNHAYEEIKSAHRDEKMDFVTSSFIEKLKKNGLSEDSFTLFDFKFNSVSNQDMNLLLGAIRATRSSILVPGESTTAISECIDVLEPKSVIVYKNDAMNKSHIDHVESELKAGRIKVLETGYEDLASLLNQNEKVSNQEGNTARASAAEKIVSDLMN